MEYDVVICGAGPAGLSTGISILFLNNDTKVLILESREVVGEEKCAEGLSESWFLKMSDYGLFLKSKLKEKCFENDLSTEEIIEIFSVANLVGGTIVIPHTRRAFEYWEELTKRE